MLVILPLYPTFATTHQQTNVNASLFNKPIFPIPRLPNPKKISILRKVLHLTQISLLRIPVRDAYSSGSNA